jgi:uncharacterized protein (DUF2336 family)
MQYREQLRTEIDEALSSAEPEWCASALRQIVDLFVRHASGYAPEHVSLYDVALNRLAERADQTGLVDLSNKLAPIENAPVGTVGYLARHENSAVAAPVLGRSSVVSTPDLVAIAKTAKHAILMLIASRPAIEPEVTDILVERGHVDVKIKAVSNPGAKFSEVCFVKLINDAKKNKALADLIAAREDLPEELRSFLALAQA